MAAVTAKRVAAEQAAEAARTVERQNEALRREQQRGEAREAWLRGPPPRLRLPGRFTQNWFADYGPRLHPGQVPALLEELHRRGWKDLDIQRRVAPYLPKSSPEPDRGTVHPAQLEMDPEHK